MCMWVCIYVHTSVHIYTPVCVCVCGLFPPLDLAPTVACLLFHHALPSKVNLLSCASPGAGADSLSIVPPTCGLLGTGLDTQWGMGGDPTSAHYDLWLRVQPAVSFRSGPGGQGATWRRPKDRIPPQLFSCGLALAQNHAVLGPSVVTSGLLTLSLGLMGLPPSLSPTGRLSCRRAPGCSSLCKVSCAWQPSAWPCLWPSASSHRCQRSVRGGAKRAG